MGDGCVNMQNNLHVPGIPSEHGEWINSDSSPHATPRVIPLRHPQYMLNVAGTGPMDGIVPGQLLYPFSGPLTPAPQIPQHFPDYRAPAPLPLAPTPLRQRASEPAFRPAAISLRPILPSGAAISSSPLSATPDAAVIKQEGEEGKARNLRRTPELRASGTKREAAVVTGSTTKNGTVHAINADGKYPCPHCSRTYLHTKHLKRHLFRHTGDRPYACELCKDTFTRSDIRNRHLQKCALRHGKPNAASNSSQARKKMAKRDGSQKNTSLGDDLNREPSSAGANDQMDEVSHQTTLGIEEMSNSPDDGPDSISDPLSRDASLKRRYDDVGGEQRDQVGPRLLGSNSASYCGSPDGSFITPGSLGRDSVAIPYSEEGQNESHLQNFVFDDKIGDFGYLEGGFSETSATAFASGHGFQDLSSTPSRQGVDPSWAQYIRNHNQGLVQDSGSSTYATVDQIPIGSALSSNQGHYTGTSQHADMIMNGLCASTATPEHEQGRTPEVFGDIWRWHLEDYQFDPLRKKTESLLAFCFPENISSTSDADGDFHTLKQYMTADNIIHFIKLFTNFQGHWPMIHTPTLNLIEAYDGLVLCIVCIGAVYSDRISLLQVRRLMDRAKYALERYSGSSDLSNGNVDDSQRTGPRSPDDTTAWLEELQAWTLLCIIFTWHGTQMQRESARAIFPRVVSMARETRMLELSDNKSPYFSIFHHRQPGAEDSGGVNWDWLAWVEQEKRSRLMYMIWLHDAALVLYFNCSPLLDSSEIRLPLPADDAAWDALTATECANALGLHGVSAQRRNTSGSRRARQLDLRTVVNALMHPTDELGPRSTNAYSKFIVIHVLHVQILRAQRELAQNPDYPLSSSHGHNADGSAFTVLNNEGAQRMRIDSQPTAGNANIMKAFSSAMMAGHAMDPRHMLKVTAKALEKWKKAWDGDMAIQYPTSTSTWRRFGFCRDAIHFYWLARAFLSGNRVFDWRASPDTRLAQSMGLLKKVRRWVASTSAQRGEEIGSIGDIDESYGVEELTLDMKLLFRPRNDQTDHPVPGVQTDMFDVFS